MPIDTISFEDNDRAFAPFLIEIHESERRPDFAPLSTSLAPLKSFEFVCGAAELIYANLLSKASPTEALPYRRETLANFDSEFLRPIFRRGQRLDLTDLIENKWGGPLKKQFERFFEERIDGPSAIASSYSFRVEVIGISKINPTAWKIFARGATAVILILVGTFSYIQTSREFNAEDCRERHNTYYSQELDKILARISQMTY